MTAPWLTPTSGALADQASRFEAAGPTLETERLRLRPARLTDYPAYEALYFDPRWPHDAGSDDAEDAWLDFCQMVAGWLLRGTGLYAAEDRASGTLVGFVTLNHEWGDPEMQLGWFVLPEAEGQGLAHEAALAVRAHARQQGLQHLVSYIGDDNPRSARLAERVGARRDPSAEAVYPDGSIRVYRHRLERIA